MAHTPSKGDVQLCSAAAVARSETHALASTSGRGCRASSYVRATSSSGRGHVSAFVGTQRMQAHPSPCLAAAASSRSSSSCGPTAQTEPLADRLGGPRRKDATRAPWQRSDERVGQTDSPAPSASGGARNGSNSHDDAGNGHSGASADYSARHGERLGCDGGSNGAETRGAADAWIAAEPTDGGADEGGPEGNLDSEAEEDDEEVAASSTPPPAALTDTSVLERVRDARAILCTLVYWMRMRACEPVRA